MIETTSTKSTITPKLFWVAAAIVASLILGLYVWIASVDWFVSDDFAFLFHVQQPWSWTKVFFPLEHPFWWTYRPLGMDSYFYFAFKLFGWNAQGFFAITIIVHALTAATVYRLGRQLGFDSRSALFATLIAISRFPSLSNLTLACCFHYVAALFFLVLTLSLFMDYAHKAKRGFLLAACIAFLSGLLCNEFVLSLPFLIGLVALYDEPVFFSRSALSRVGLRILPFFVIAGIFVFYRYGILTYPEPPFFYKFILGRHILYNALANLYFLAGSATAFYVGLSILATVMTAVGFAKHRPVELKSTLFRRHMVVLPWLIGMSVVLAALPFPQERFAMTLQIPVGLLCAVWLDALLLVCRSKVQRIVEVAMVVFLSVSLPWDKVVARAALPKGVWMRNFQRTVLDAHPDLPDRAVVSVLYGGCGRAEGPAADEFKLLGYGPAVIRSRYPYKRIDVRYWDIVRSASQQILCHQCRYFELLPSRKVKALTVQQALERMRTAKPFCDVAETDTN